MNRPHEGYDAFISYSEAFDGAVTPAVQRGLERLARPRPRRPALSVFRDETGLSVTDDLWGEIKKALLASRYLIVICSPSAAASDWVAKEIKFWLESHREDLRIILVMTAGEWRWSESDNDFDWSASSSVPQELRGAFRAEPLAANLFGLRRNQLTLRNDRFRRQVAKIASPIREQPREQLDNAEKRSQRRSDLLKTTSAAVLVFLIALSLILYHANSVSNQVAMSRELAAEAGSTFDSNPYVSMLLSVSAEKVADTTEAASVLLRQSYGREGLTSLFQGLGTGDRFVHCLSYGARSDVLAYCTGDNILVRNRKSVGYSTFALPVRHAVNSALFLKGSPFLLVGAGSALEFWDVVHKREVRVLEIPKGNIQRIVASGDGSVVAVSTDQAYIAVWKIRSGDRLMIPVVADNTRTLSLNSDGSRIAYTNSGKVILRNLRSNQAEVIRSRDGSAVSLAVDPANDCIAVGYGDGFVSLWNAAGSQLLARQRISADSQVASLVFTTSSGHLLGGDIKGTVTVMNASDLEPQHVLNTLAAAVVSLAVNSAGDLFAAGTTDNVVAEWSIQKMGLVDPVASPLNDPSDVHVASSPDGEYVAASADQAYVLEWTLNNGWIPRRFNLAATASALGYSQDSRLLAAGDQAGRIYLLTSTGMSLRRNILAYDDAVDALDFSPGGTELVTASANGKISAWTVPGLNKVWEHEVAGQPINSVAYSNDGRVLVTSSADGYVREFDASAGKLLYKHRIARVLVKV